MSTSSVQGSFYGGILSSVFYSWHLSTFVVLSGIVGARAARRVERRRAVDASCLQSPIAWVGTCGGS